MVAVAAEEEEPANLDLPKKLFHCAACRAPLKPPVFKCEREHFVCRACSGDDDDGDGDGGATKHCGPCGHGVSYTHSEFMDGVVSAYKVPCPYKKHGCPSSIVYHAAADHKAKCAHAPCYCFECTPPFEGSPADLLRHLTAPSGKHSWLTDKIKYESSHPLVVQVPSGDYRCLLVAEDGCVFLLAVDAGKGAAGGRPVNVVCVRGNADTRPLYTGVLWVDGPPAAAGHLRGSVQVKGDVASCSVPGEVDMEQGWLHAHVNPNMLHGESGEVHPRLRVTKFP
ncbi:E3 ubiquitin-protein ligase SINA-like 5 [Triticum aestivum]|uniref:E3 ubiquitin-protein ligase SINA-like 5 n=1 Tax=Triticum aestivum TaxID=4565 RepID=UPI001D022290|nr:E3 ubiquitin-protein ligase SINA-like 5 [Triticum aestivum]